MKRLPVLCPQQYDGVDMEVTTCDRCPIGWDRKEKKCTVDTGAEHLGNVHPARIPTCPMQDRCQHQIQSLDKPCLIRRKGLICESALSWAGVENPASHPLGFSALTVASKEELAEREVERNRQRKQS